jgi:hypothetical protein
LGLLCVILHGAGQPALARAGVARIGSATFVGLRDQSLRFLFDLGNRRAVVKASEVCAVDGVNEMVLPSCALKAHWTQSARAVVTSVSGLLAAVDALEAA